LHVLGVVVQVQAISTAMELGILEATSAALASLAACCVLEPRRSRPLRLWTFLVAVKLGPTVSSILPGRSAACVTTLISIRFVAWPKAPAWFRCTDAWSATP
jgi:hypothetical protein